MILRWPFARALVVASAVLGIGCGSSTTAPTSPLSTGQSAEPSTEPKTDSTHDMAGMDVNEGMPAEGLTIKLSTRSFIAGQHEDLAFMIVDSDGAAVKEYKVEQTKELHLILVRDDLTGYQHIHPTRGTDGTWSVPVTFDRGGKFRMVADFVPVLHGKATGRTEVTTDLKVSGILDTEALPDPTTTVEVDGFTVSLKGELGSDKATRVNFTVVDNADTPVVLGQYLGSFGHLVAFAQKDLAYTHIHPSSSDEKAGKIQFRGQVAAPGPHRLFLQFSVAGVVHTAAFTMDIK